MALNYSALPGFGDIHGDSRHPNSPDYVEPAFGLDDAAGNVAQRMHEAGDIGEVIFDLSECGALMQHFAETGMPGYLLRTFQALAKHVNNAETAVQAEYAALNEEHA